MNMQIAKSPVERVMDLGLLPAADIQQFASRERAFDWVHVGNTDLPIHEVLNAIKQSEELLPPRSGHMGNWEEITLGRAGVMDFNHAICAEGYGYPLIYSFNQTEDSELTGGDWVYMPGSVLEQGVRSELNLYTWDGASFVQRNRIRPLFVPFVLTEADGVLQPVSQLHWSRMTAAGQFSFRLEGAAIWEHGKLVKDVLRELLETAAVHPNPRRAYQDLISHQVSLDGTMVRAELEREGAAYRLGATRYAGTDELVDAVMLPFQAVAEPQAFFANIRELPDTLPILSNIIAGVLSAVVHTHYPGAQVVRDQMTRPFNPHFHWGARDMAGYPPVRKGYFAEKSTIKSYRHICQTIIRNFHEIDPLYFILMPAAVFTLWPADCHEADRWCIGQLISSVKEKTDQLSGRPDQMMPCISQIVEEWLSGAESQCSHYWLNRFGTRRGILNEGDIPRSSRPVEPDGFGHLTFRQACMIVGALNQLR
ncbi:hypothetical protein DNH61_06250 [Paenibacillus sambharensis]|uniref:Uncharacterized protein n=1 Tax=Paenibacillus sambharensis TaxID=1803190 RepID=A0A2W1LPL3_9BACL|nr:DUF6025 family protein [Paenibacillus sambharensis]PZD96795.1 hypothetical protein DNH61_06250 [Paenibacillus sambharensis]